MNDRNNNEILKQLEKLRKKLLETGPRNRLIHVNRDQPRSNSLNIIDEDADFVYSALRLREVKMHFKPTGEDKPKDDDIPLLPPPLFPAQDDDDQDEDCLRTPLGPEEQARRLLRIFGAARTVEEEQGVNVLYLAIGFLHWKESTTTSQWRDAPLILLPVQLKRNSKTSTFDIVCQDSDISTNLSLQERLKMNFGIDLPEIDDSDELMPTRYFESVTDAISGQPGWYIDENGMQLGLFSFSKFLMYQDFDCEALSDNPFIQKLLMEGFPKEKQFFGEGEKIDEVLDPADIIQVMDADASQTKVIEEVRKGSSMIVQGPPGTGKSQTITNIIAAAVYDGKSVLFVAEKMAALTIVHDNIKKLGLGDICMELHSKFSNKREFSQELDRTLKAAENHNPSDDRETEELRKSRDELNRICDLLHKPILKTEETPYGALSDFVGFSCDGAPSEIPIEGLESIGKDERVSISDDILKYVSARNRVKPVENHPFRGAKNHDLIAPDFTRLKKEIGNANQKIEILLEKANRIASLTRQPAPNRISDIRGMASILDLLSQAPDDTKGWISIFFDHVGNERLNESLEIGKAWQNAYIVAKDVFSRAAFSCDVEKIQSEIIQGQMYWTSRWFGGYRKASKELSALLLGELPRTAKERRLLIDQLDEVQSARNLLADHEDWLKKTLEEEWRGESTPFEKFHLMFQWLKEFRKNAPECTLSEIEEIIGVSDDLVADSTSIRNYIDDVLKAIDVPLKRLNFDLHCIGVEGATETLPLQNISNIFQGMIDCGQGGYDHWVDYVKVSTRAEGTRASFVISQIDAGKIDADEAKREFLCACAEARWKHACNIEPDLQDLLRTNRHDLVKSFCECDKNNIEKTRDAILSKYYSRVSHIENDPSLVKSRQINHIRRQVALKKGHKSIRWMMDNAGDAIQVVKPVMLMSPISVVQYLQRRKIGFDLLVMDEASQIRPEDSFGAISRSKQIVVVGDEKQLPPTSFFDRIDLDYDPGEEDDAPSSVDIESILSLCQVSGLSSRMLEWHYRSRVPSLIRVSNGEFYNDRLILPPSPLQDDPNYGLKFTNAHGQYSRGGSGSGRRGTNLIEAMAIADRVSEHARSTPEYTLGVVAFSKSQADMITDVLESKRREDSVLDRFLGDQGFESVFVKNIENVQGDERDVILISVGYGPEHSNESSMRMTFGPINVEGGERRLNVLFTRSRVRCEVFASFEPGAIDVSRIRNRGPKVLKRFLEYAKTGIYDQAEVTGLGPDSAFEEDVARVIRTFEYIADHQVGVRGFRIDIGVKHRCLMGEYLLAVECDGASYHSALWARERDRLRQEILENLGWQFHRIWSTDWFHDREREIKRLRKALDDSWSLVNDSGDHGDSASQKDEDKSSMPSYSEVDNTPDFDGTGNYSDLENLDNPSEFEGPMDSNESDIEQDESDLEHDPANYDSASVIPYERYEGNVAGDYATPGDAPTDMLVRIVTKIIEVEGPIHRNEIARRVATVFGLRRAGSQVSRDIRRVVNLVMKQASLADVDSFILTEEQLKNVPIRDRSNQKGTVQNAENHSQLEILAAKRLIVELHGGFSTEQMKQKIAKIFGYKRVGPALAKVIDRALSSDE